MKTMSTAEKAALFDRMVGMGVIDTTKLLSDFSTTLAGVLETELEELDEPVFTNPTTGKEASSVHAILLALDYGHIPNWPALVRYLKKNGGDAVFMRRDLTALARVIEEAEARGEENLRPVVTAWLARQ